MQKVSDLSYLSYGVFSFGGKYVLFWAVLLKNMPYFLEQF